MTGLPGGCDGEDLGAVAGGTVLDLDFIDCAEEDILRLKGHSGPDVDSLSLGRNRAGAVDPEADGLKALVA